MDNSFASDAVRLPRFEDSKYSRGVVGLVTGSQRYPGAAVLTASAAARANTGMVRYLGPERAQNMVLAALPEAVIGKGHVQSWVVGSGVPEASVEGTDGDMQRDTIAALLKHYALGSEDENKDAYDMPPIVVRNRRQHRGACRFARAVHRRRRAVEPVGQREACPRAHRRHRIVEGRGDHRGG